MSETMIPDFNPTLGPVRHSDMIGELAGALAAAQLKFSAIVKKTVNPYFNSKYADLSQVISATQESLAEQGLVIIQFPIVREKEAGVDSWLSHKSGQWMARELLLPALMKGKDGSVRFDAQSVGSAITYARRYAYQALVGVAAEVDDDGNAASNGNGSKDAAKAVAERKIAEHQTKSAHGESADKGAVPPVQGSAAALKIVQFHDTDADIIMREWKGVPRPWQRIDGNGLGELLAGLERTDQHFKNTFMWCDEGELIWYVMKAKAEDLAAAAVSMGLDAKQAARIAPRVSNSVPEASGEAIANAFPVIESVRKVEQGVTTPFISVKWGGADYSCFHKSMWQYLENGIGQPADLTLSNPVKKNGKQYQNIVGLRSIGNVTFTDSIPDLQQRLR